MGNVGDSHPQPPCFPLRADQNGVVEKSRAEAPSMVTKEVPGILRSPKSSARGASGSAAAWPEPFREGGGNRPVDLDQSLCTEHPLAARGSGRGAPPRFHFRVSSSGCARTISSTRGTFSPEPGVAILEMEAGIGWLAERVSWPTRRTTRTAMTVAPVRRRDDPSFRVLPPPPGKDGYQHPVSPCQRRPFWLREMKMSLRRFPRKDEADAAALHFQGSGGHRIFFTRP
jgi:hypothetical protein